MRPRALFGFLVGAAGGWALTNHLRALGAQRTATPVADEAQPVEASSEPGAGPDAGDAAGRSDGAEHLPPGWEVLVGGQNPKPDTQPDEAPSGAPTHGSLEAARSKVDERLRQTERRRKRRAKGA